MSDPYTKDYSDEEREAILDAIDLLDDGVLTQQERTRMVLEPGFDPWKRRRELAEMFAREACLTDEVMAQIARAVSDDGES